MIDGRETLQEIYGRHKRGFFLLALSITHCSSDAEDAVHDAFARMCRGGGGVGRPRVEPVAYAFAAVRNAAIDRRRRRHLAQELPMALAACLDQAALTNERDQAIARAVDALEEDRRTIVILRNYGGLTLREIGEMTHTPLQTIASRYAAALKELEPELRKWS